jgi:hypothetical protein
VILRNVAGSDLRERNDVREEMRMSEDCTVYSSGRY